MISCEQVVSSIRNRIDDIKTDYDINFLILFGSVIDKNRNMHFDSDIDIVVSLPNYKPTDYTTNPLIALSSYFDTILNRNNVNVIRWEDLSQHLKFEIFKKGVEIFVKNREEFRKEMELTMKLFWDHDIWYKDLVKQTLVNSG